MPHSERKAGNFCCQTAIFARAFASPSARASKKDLIFLKSIYPIVAGGNPYGIQHMLYEADCPVPELVRTRPHLAFVVVDLDAALVGKDVLITPNNPSQGVRVAFIADRGEPVELMEFDRPDHPLA